MSSQQGGAGSPAPLNPDSRWLECLQCGEVFWAEGDGEHWHPTCFECWQANRAGWRRRLARTPAPIPHRQRFRKGASR